MAGCVDIYLASQSSRRAELLQQLGLRFEVVGAAVDETPHVGEMAEDYVMRLAHAKAEAGVARLRGSGAPLVLAADTTVEIDGDILGKPRDRTEGMEMLTRLSGREHRVLSCVALYAGGEARVRLSVSRVRFRSIKPGEAAAYWETGEPADKAGGYAIQGRAALFVERLEGSYSGVMGLPLFETAELLRAAGVEVLSVGYKE